MRQSLIITLLLTAALGLWAESMPSGYYRLAQGKQGAELKTALCGIVSGGQRYSYGAGVASTWAGFYYTDRDTTDNSVIDMYSTVQRFFNPANPTASVSELDIEHMFPKSWWGGTVNKAYKDLYHLSPADYSANRSKSNNAPGYVQSATFDNGYFKIGSNSAYPISRVFEPADEWKGDFARAYFYIVTAYENILTWVTDANNAAAYSMNNDSYLAFEPWIMQTLLEWHRNDPVSEREKERADAVNHIQHNRNPFIDYPELVEYIWGNKSDQAVDFHTLTQSWGIEYDAPASIIALPATDISQEGFTAHWQSTTVDNYTLSVFRLQDMGDRIDTLLYEPRLTIPAVNANVRLTMSGDNGTSNTTPYVQIGPRTSSGTTGYLVAQVSGVSDETILQIEAARFKNNNASKMTVKADGQTLQTIALTADTALYCIELPENTGRISISNATSGVAIVVKSIVVTKRYLEPKRIDISGYPTQTGNVTSWSVSADMTEGPVYYYVTPAEMEPTNTITVNYNPAGLTAETSYDDGIVRIYDIQGNLLFTSGDSEDILTQLPAGLYIRRAGNKTTKYIVR